MYEIFEQLLQQKGLTAYKVSKETGITQSTLSDWKRGRSTPKTDNMKKLADFLGVTIEYIMTGVEPSEGTNVAESLLDIDDIGKEIGNLRSKLERKVLYCNGKPLDDKRKAALLSVLELAYDDENN